MMFVVVELKKNPLFRKIDWENIHSVEPPFVPNPDDDSDTSYFNGIFPSSVLSS
jgi:hypothetical protein